jgi:hypothetical protein
MLFTQISCVFCQQQTVPYMPDPVVMLANHDIVVMTNHDHDVCMVMDPTTVPLDVNKESSPLSHVHVHQ